MPTEPTRTEAVERALLRLRRLYFDEGLHADILYDPGLRDVLEAAFKEYDEDSQKEVPCECDLCRAVRRFIGEGE